MSIIRNEIPILEFDTDKNAILKPNHEKLNIKIPEKAVFLFLGNLIDEYVKDNKCKKIGEFESITKKYPIYINMYKGEEVCICQAPAGSAPSTQILDWLIAYGAKKIISAGSCGTLVDIKENTFLVPYKAIRDEGTSYHYMKPSRYADINTVALRAIENAIKENGFDYEEVMTWTTDGFFRETKAKTQYRIEEGCKVVEMECSALAACANMRNAIWGEILYTADSLANPNKHDMRGLGVSSMKMAFKLALDSVIKL